MSSLVTLRMLNSFSFLTPKIFFGFKILDLFFPGFPERRAFHWQWSVVRTGHGRFEWRNGFGKRRSKRSNENVFCTTRMVFERVPQTKHIPEMSEQRDELPGTRAGVQVRGCRREKERVVVRKDLKGAGENTLLFTKYKLEKGTGHIREGEQ